MRSSAGGGARAAGYTRREGTASGNQIYAGGECRTIKVSVG